MEAYGLEEGTIVTMHDSVEEMHKDKKIHIVPIYEWLKSPV